MSEDIESGHVTQAQADNLADAEGFFEQGERKRTGMFFFVFDGSICLKSREIIEGWEGPVPTTNPRTGEEVLTFVKRFDKLICRIVDLTRVKKEFKGGGRAINWNFKLLAAGKKATLQATWCDQFLRKFLKVAPNIDFEKSILLGAFMAKDKNDSSNKVLRIRIAQGGTNATSDDWVPVPFFWVGEKDEPQIGADGSILPKVIQDEDDGTWDFKPQEKFLRDHFLHNTLPRIKAVGEALGIEHTPDAEVNLNNGDTPAFSGAAQVDDDDDHAVVKKSVEDVVFITKEKPEVMEAQGLADSMTTGQVKRLRALATQVNADLDKLSNKLCGIDADELSKNGAGYLIYRLEKKIRKARLEDPNAYPDPAASKLKPAVQQMQAEKTAAKTSQAPVTYAGPEDDEEIPFGFREPENPPTPAKKAAPALPPDDDDDDF